MGISTHIDYARRLIVSTIAGTLTDGDIHTYLTGLWADPVTATLDTLVYIQAGTVFLVTQDGLHMAGAINNTSNVDRQSFRVAIVAEDDLSYGMARMYEAYQGSTPSQTHIFRTTAAALAWLRPTIPE